MIVVLTYNHPHRKTQDVLFKLVASGVRPLVIATEWEDRKSFVPIISHRPANPMNIELEILCENLGLNLVITKKANLYRELQKISNIEYILLATGNIIEKDIAVNYKVINSHPAYLPVIKGLDALKWAILLKENIGVTTHFINEQVDCGIIIERKLVPVYYEDTFHNLAYRQYEMEVDMLVNSVKVKPENIPIAESKYETFHRMPHRLEYRMLEKFNELKEETIFRTEQMYKAQTNVMI